MNIDDYYCSFEHLTHQTNFLLKKCPYGRCVMFLLFGIHHLELDDNINDDHTKRLNFTDFFMSTSRGDNIIMDHC